MIEVQKLEQPDLFYQKIFKQIGNYPIIKEIMGESWFKRMKRGNNKTHPLLIELSKDPPHAEDIKVAYEAAKQETGILAQYNILKWIKVKMKPIAFLRDLEDMLRVIIGNSTKLRKLKQGLKSEDSFWPTISEIEVISPLMRIGRVDLSPKINGKELDAKCEINGYELLIEITTPDLSKRLKDSDGNGIWIKNRARDKIYDEYKRHLKAVSHKLTVPVLIVIDISRSEIASWFVAEYLDEMHVLNDETDVISGVLWYKRDFYLDDKFHFEGRIFPNKHAKNPINHDLIEKICKILFK